MQQARKKTIGRRGAIAGALVLAAGGAAFAAHWFNLSGDIGARALPVEDAHARALAGSVTLVDIRRPDEWAHTGLGEGAHPLDMRRPDFVQALLDLVQGDPNAPIALICARGVRSRYVAERLAEAGFTQVLDVPEGMMGSGAGQGWLRKALPVVRHEGANS